MSPTFLCLKVLQRPVESLCLGLSCYEVLCSHALYLQAVAQAVLRDRAGLSSRNRGSSFLFLGPTGEAARVVQQAVSSPVVVNIGNSCKLEPSTISFRQPQVASQGLPANGLPAAHSRQPPADPKQGLPEPAFPGACIV